MILPLRQWHRRIFAALGVLLPLLLAAGIASRKAALQLEFLPPELISETFVFTATGHEWDDLFERSPVRTRLWREQGSGRLAVGFAAPKNFLKPDLLVYWSAARPPANDALPANASLLGAFVAGPLALPEEASAKDGFLILFSLGNQEIVDVSKPAKFTDSTNQPIIER